MTLSDHDDCDPSEQSTDPSAQGRDEGGAGFDELLRQRRLAAGLTQADLAARAGIGVRTVRDLERGRSSRPQRTTVALLGTALGLTGSDRDAFLVAARGATALPVGAAAAEPAAGTPGAAPAVADTAPRTFGLPAPVQLIGRDADVAEIADLITAGPAAGIVNLVGLAGVGKTGLALAVGARLGAAHPGGVAGIVITEESSAGEVLAAIATVFGVGRSADLAARLAGAQALLVVDAVERAPDAVAEILRSLAASAPTLRILATGRHPVGVPGERVWPVAPLEVPPAEAGADLASVARYPAAALFLARLRQVRRDPLDPGEVSALADLVRRLGGLPLALELAAARGRVLDLNEMLDRYGDRVLDLASRPATREAVAVNLRDAVAASYRLLEPGEQAALRRLSMFRNRWSVELAEAMLADVPGPDGDPVGTSDQVPLLDRLVALGLLSVRGSGPYRFRLLDVVRDFAVEQAAAVGETTPIRRRHAMIFARLAGRIAGELTGANLPAGVGRLDEVSSDLSAALAHSANDDPHTALFLASRLPRWWRFRGRDVAGRQWLRRVLDDPRTSDADPTTRAWAKVGLGQLAAEHHAGRQELPAVEEALATFQRLGDVAGELAAHTILCRVWTAAGGYDRARRHGEAVLALASRTSRVRDMAVAQNNLTWHEIRVGDLRAARRRLAAVDQLAAQCGDDRLRALTVANLAEVARLDGRYADAVTLGRRASAALADLGDPGHRRRVLGTVGLALAQDGRLDEAAAVLAELRARPAGAVAEPCPADEPDPSAIRELPPGYGACASIEATMALRRGDRELAAEWYAVAARTYASGHDLRDVAEALVGLVATTDDPPERTAVRDRLAAVCVEGGITLLPGERVLIRSSGAVPSAQRRTGAPAGSQ
ncbi:ATP-binding protein [Polymorphospora rubra]|uniref:XRE family transcriptional regulator n=1 Tax=Polymorphospora rubra TaxID=338584 RepID=A0A810MW95_9ACTN|nr:helix-turn-helix domain-containing protein [Polymorphospora rubra]BCJ65437.1 XRE family transcriptional regulator [Polymorphospora rubra]